ncbi:hypothetical protein BCV70DRAFT_201456 [Testicularia cyperi]|uniref:Uncharacterized protein n=1 Tax=Testicularia cyperi TaxID=1882483 RepID=A0A317XK37_9BASI|nr:hypothetical protein BCV70DRAFT_201456 [Testicularia cyperi]
MKRSICWVHLFPGARQSFAVSYLRHSRAYRVKGRNMPGATLRDRDQHHKYSAVQTDNSVDGQDGRCDRARPRDPNSASLGCARSCVSCGLYALHRYTLHVKRAPTEAADGSARSRRSDILHKHTQMEREEHMAENA